MNADSIDVDRLTPALGAEVRGVDLDQTLPAEVVDRLYDLLIEHLVLFLPDQTLAPAKHTVFAQQFGELDVPHPVYPHVDGHDRVILLENDGERPPNTDVWHTDVTFQTTPPFASVLYAVEVPACGGDTLWASMYAAYDALPQDMKQHLKTLSAVHSVGSFWNEYVKHRGTDAVNETTAELGAAVHPVVVSHPVTGRPLLYVNRHFTTHILGMSSADSQRLLTYLFDHINQPDFQVRHRWHANTVAIWDNRVTQHYAVADYLPARRRMHRVTVVNDKRLQRAQSRN